MAKAFAPAPYRFSVDEWHQMGEAGLFDEDARVELLDGEVVTMSPIGPRHAVCVARLNRLLWRALGDRAVIRVQDPIGLDQHSEPEPDLALTRPPLEAYLTVHPGPGDLFLVIEVADTTYESDRGRKALLYARAGVPECWVVSLGTDRVVVLSEPGPDGYRDERIAGRGEQVEPAGLPGVVLSVDDIFG